MIEQEYNYLDVLSMLWQKSLRQELKIQKNQSYQVFPQETEGKARNGQREGNWLLLMILMMKNQIKDKRKKVFQYHGMCRYTMDQ